MFLGPSSPQIRIRIRIQIEKNWDRIRIIKDADPKHCLSGINCWGVKTGNLTVPGVISTVASVDDTALSAVDISEEEEEEVSRVVVVLFTAAGTEEASGASVAPELSFDSTSVVLSHSSRLIVVTVSILKKDENRING